MIEFSVRTFLLDQVAVEGIVGQRVYPLRAPQDVSTYPLVVYRRTGGVRNHNLDGGVRVSTADLEFAAIAESYDAAKTLADELRKALQGWRGTVGGDTVTAVLHADEKDDYFDPEDGSDNGYFIVATSFQVQYREEVVHEVD